MVGYDHASLDVDLMVACEQGYSFKPCFRDKSPYNI